MGHFCRICQCVRANERFSGKGHRTQVCKDCRQLPKAVRAVIEQEQEVAAFLQQSRISEKNLKRLQTLTEAEEPRIAEMAAVVIEVARVKPYRKRRIQILARERRDLLDALARVGLIDEYEAWGDDEDWAGY